MVAGPLFHCSTTSWLTPAIASQKPPQVSRTASRPVTGSELPKRKDTSSDRWRAKRSGSIESMSSNSVGCADMVRSYGSTVIDPREEMRRAQSRLHQRQPSPDVLRRRCAGGLRLPRPHAGPEERQEDRALRRRDPDLPPLLRQPGGGRVDDPDSLPVPPGG